MASRVSRQNVAAVAAMLSVGFAVARADSKPGAGAINSELRAELKRRVKEDQDARFAMIRWMQENKAVDAAKVKEQEDAPLAKKVREIDAANTRWLKELVEKQGWPGK